MGLFRKKIKKITNSYILKKDELTFLRIYEYFGTYSNTSKIKNTQIDFILSQYRNQNEYNELIILSKLNDYHYPFFDIDDIDKYNHFCNNTDSNYVSFQSSPGHFWVIVDKPFISLQDFIKDPIFNDWIVYSDDKYTKLVSDKFYIRGTFKTLMRQPVIDKKIGVFSDDFKTLIEKIVEHYDTDGLELSMLRYKQPDMLLQFKRMKKLTRILK